MIELIQVKKSFGKHQVVNALSLSINQGEIYGFLGPNGAGKTTTVRMMVGLLSPDRGTIQIAGFSSLDRSSEARRCIGYMAEQPYLYGRLSGIEFLRFIQGLYGLKAGTTNDEITEWLEYFDLLEAQNKQIRTYSHGMKQKIGLIAALMHKPPVLVLDEPMNALDPRSSHAMRQLLARLSGAGTTIFLCTHLLSDAENFCTRVGIILDGTLVAEGTPEGLRGQESLEAVFLKLTEKSKE